MALTVGVAGCGAVSTPVPADNAAAQAGAAKFASACAGCHSASSLRSGAGLIMNDLGSLSSRMSGITLTDAEVADLKAYLATQ